MNFLKLFHQCFSGRRARTFRKRLMVPEGVPGDIRRIASHMAVIRRDKPEEIAATCSRDSIHRIYREPEPHF